MPTYLKYIYFFLLLFDIRFDPDPDLSFQLSRIQGKKNLDPHPWMSGFKRPPDWETFSCCFNDNTFHFVKYWKIFIDVNFRKGQ